MLAIAPIHDSSNLTALILSRRMYAPSLSASAEALRRGSLAGLAYATDALVAPPATQTNDQPPLRPAIQPATWPYRFEHLPTPAAQPYAHHTIPSGDIRNPYDAHAAYAPLATENARFFDVYA